MHDCTLHAADITYILFLVTLIMIKMLLKLAFKKLQEIMVS